MWNLPQFQALGYEPCFSAIGRPHRARRPLSATSSSMTHMETTLGSVTAHYSLPCERNQINSHTYIARTHTHASALCVQKEQGSLIRKKYSKIAFPHWKISESPLPDFSEEDRCLESQHQHISGEDRSLESPNPNVSGVDRPILILLLLLLLLLQTYCYH